MFWSKRKHTDFRDEVEAHVALETDRLIAEGLSPADARQAALRSFGNVLATQETYYEKNRWIWLEHVVQDVRYGCRGLLRSPAFTATTVLTLSVGMAIVVMLFAVFNAYVLRPFAVHDPYSLHRISWRAPGTSGNLFSSNECRQLRERQDLFSDVMAQTNAVVASPGGTRLVGFVTGNFFQSLGVRTFIGRQLTPEDTTVAVLTHQFWKDNFNGDEGMLGREIELNDRRLTVVGVLRPEFGGLEDTPRDIWAPLAMADLVLPGKADQRSLGIIARLRPGITSAQAAGALQPFMADLTGKPDTRAEVQLHATPVPFSFELFTTLSPIFAVFGVVLLAACTNVSNVMLARANARYREISVRLSIGASRSRIVRQLLTEGLLIAFLAGLASLALAAIGLRTGATLFLQALPPSGAAAIRVTPLEFDARVVLFTLAAAASATMIFALLPALHGTRLNLTDALRGQQGATFRGSKLRNVLVIGQVTVSLVLLIATATLARNANSLTNTDIGINRRGVITVTQRPTDNPAKDTLVQAVHFLRNDPQIESVAVASRRPLWTTTNRIVVTPEQATSSFVTSYTFVSDAYFSTLQLPILRGRAFLPSEAQTGARVAVISTATAKAFWPGGDPIGKMIRIEHTGDAHVDDLPGYSSVMVVGVTKDVASSLVFDGTDLSHVYLATSPTGANAKALIVRNRSRDDRTDTVRNTLRKLDLNPFAFDVLPLNEIFDLQMFPIRIASAIGIVLSAIALALSLSGLYGVLAYTLSQRTREIGIRMALGGTRLSVVQLVLRQSLRLTAVGAAIGAFIAIVVMKALSSVVEMRNVAFLDVGSFAISLALVTVAALVAGLIPARRATQVEPSQALRAD